MAVSRSLALQPLKRLNPLNFHISQFGGIVSNTVTTRLLRRACVPRSRVRVGVGVGVGGLVKDDQLVKKTKALAVLVRQKFYNTALAAQIEQAASGFGVRDSGGRAHLQFPQILAWRVVCGVRDADVPVRSEGAVSIFVA